MEVISTKLVRHFNTFPEHYQHNAKKNPKADEDGLALRGVLVRHLVMPGRLEDTRQIVGWLSGLSKDTYLNLMDQYAPAWKAKTNPRFAEINRRVTRPEMMQTQDLARAAGLWRLDDRWREVSREPRNRPDGDGSEARCYSQNR
jgi:uncharacterized Fe-S radical SAM superfamily protein PflX